MNHMVSMVSHIQTGIIDHLINMGDINLTNSISVNHTSGVKITVLNNIAVIRPRDSERAAGHKTGSRTESDHSPRIAPGIAMDRGVEDDLLTSPQVSDIETEEVGAVAEAETDATADRAGIEPQNSVCESEVEIEIGLKRGRQGEAGAHQDDDHVKAGETDDAPDSEVATEGGVQDEGVVPHEDDGGEARGRPLQPQLAGVAAIDDDEVRPETGPGAEVRGASGWPEACHIKRCQRCLRKDLE